MKYSTPTHMPGAVSSKNGLVTLPVVKSAHSYGQVANGGPFQKNKPHFTN